MSNDLEIEQANQELASGLSTITTYLLAVIGPLLLILVHQLLPLTYLIEELWKLVLVRRIHKQTKNGGVTQAFIIGLLFGLSEWILYIMNAFLAQNGQTLFERLLLTVPMHSVTAALIFVIGRRGGAWWIVGLAAGVAVHGLFNYAVG